MIRFILFFYVLLALPAPAAATPPIVHADYATTLRTRRDALESALPIDDMTDCNRARDDFRSATMSIDSLRAQIDDITRELDRFDPTLPGADEYRVALEQNKASYTNSLGAAENRLAEAKALATAAGTARTKAEETRRRLLTEIDGIIKELQRLEGNTVPMPNAAAERPLIIRREDPDDMRETPLPEEFRVCFPEEVTAR